MAGPKMPLWMADHEWCSPGLILRPVLFDIFTSYLEVGIEWTLREFADDIKLGRTVNLPEVRKALMRELDGLDWRTASNHLGFNWVVTTPWSKVGLRRAASKLHGRKWPGAAGHQTAGWTCASSVPKWPRRTMASWLVLEIVWPAELRKCLSSCEQHWWGCTSSAVQLCTPPYKIQSCLSLCRDEQGSWWRD